MWESFVSAGSALRRCLMALGASMGKDREAGGTTMSVLLDMVDGVDSGEGRLGGGGCGQRRLDFMISRCMEKPDKFNRVLDEETGVRIGVECAIAIVVCCCLLVDADAEACAICENGQIEPPEVIAAATVDFH